MIEQNLASTPQKKFHWAYLVLIGTCFIQFGCMGTVSSCMGIFTPSVIEDLQTSATAVSLYFTIRTLVMSVFQPFAEKILSKLDSRISCGLAVLLANGSMAMLAFCHHIAWWYVSAAIAGCGLGIICYVMSPVVLNNWFKSGYGTAVGISLAFTGLGGMFFAPMVGGWIAEFGFRNAYLLAGGVGGAAGLIGAIVFLRTKPEDMGMKPLELGSDKKKETSPEETMGLTFKEALKTPAFIGVVLITICTFFGPCFMTDLTNMAVSKGFDVQFGAQLSSRMSLGIMVGKILLGFVRDRFGVKITAVVAAVFGAVSLLVLMNSGGLDPMVSVWAGGFLFGCFVAEMSMIPPLATKYAFGGKDYTSIYSKVIIFGTLTSAIAHPIYAATFDATGQYDSALAIALVTVVVGVVLIFTLVGSARKKWLADK